MLDIQLLRTKTEETKQNLLKRTPDGKFDLKKILALDDRRKEDLRLLENLRAEKNKISKTKPTPEIIAQMKIQNEETKKLEGNLRLTEDELKTLMSELPNITADDVVAGGKENNRIIKTFRKKPHFKFAPKDHVELATTLDIIDYERGVKMSGNGFWIYRGDGALLEWALLNYFIEFHRKNKYTFLIPPYLLTEQSAYTSGHLPKFREDLFWTQDKTCLNATSEMMLGNYHRDEILNEEKLPIKYFAYSTCFRREAGAYRKEERGMIRGHQFNKIEMFQYALPENSSAALEELVNKAERLVQGLGLHHRVSLLAAGDASAGMAKTYDIEVWLPSMNDFKEVSSASNARDYQARRGNIRVKRTGAKKTELLHTLNASGLATSRLLPAICEQFQQADGSVVVPEVLRQWVGTDILRA